MMQCHSRILNSAGNNLHNVTANFVKSDKICKD